MAVEAGIVRVVVDVQASGVTKELNKVEKSFDKTAKSAGNMDKGVKQSGKGLDAFGGKIGQLGAKLKSLMMNPLVLAAAAIVALGKVMKDSFKAYQVTIDSQRKLNAVLNAGVPATKAQKKELENLVGELELLTGVGDEVIRGVFGQAKAFQMSTEDIKKYGKELIAISKVGGDRVFQNMFDGTKSINTAFKELGVTFTEAEIAASKLVPEQEKIAYFMDLATKKGADFSLPFEGMEGTMSRIKTMLGGIQEDIGSVNGDPILNFMEGIEQLLMNNQDSIKQFSYAVGEVGVAFFDLIEIIKTIKEALGGLGLSNSFRESLQFVTDTLNFITATLGGISALLKGELDIAGLYFKKAMDGFLGLITKTVTMMMKPFQWLIGAILTGLSHIPNVFNGIVNGMISGFEGFVNSAIKGINALIRGLNKIPLLGLDISEIGELALGRIDVGSEAFEEAKAMIDGLDEGLENVSIFDEEDQKALDALLDREDDIQEEGEEIDDSYLTGLDESNQDVKENIQAAASTLNQNFDDLFKDISRGLIDPRTGNVGAFATNILSQSPEMTSSFTGGMGGSTAGQTITTDVVLDGQRVGKAMTNVFKLAE